MTVIQATYHFLSLKLHIPFAANYAHCIVGMSSCISLLCSLLTLVTDLLNKCHESCLYQMNEEFTKSSPYLRVTVNPMFKTRDLIFFFALVSKALESIIHFEITPHLSNSQLGFLKSHPCLKHSLSRSELLYTLWLLGITGPICC